MYTSLFKKVALVFSVSISAIMLVACATAPIKSSEALLRERVDGLMQAKINNNWAGVYEYYTPDFKEENSKDQFVRMNRQMHFKNYTIQSIEMDPSGKAATVIVRYDFRVLGSLFHKNDTQKWVRDGGQWYQEPKISDVKSLFRS